MIYYALFQNIAFYGIEAWGGAYNNVSNPLTNIQNRLLKIIGVEQNCVINFKQAFVLNSILINYDKLKSDYINSTSITRNKNLHFKAQKSIGFKNHKIVATKYFNVLPSHLKILNSSKKTIKNNIKQHIISTKI